MSLLQPESPAWGNCYLALLGAAQAGELTTAQELLTAGTPGSTLSALYPLDSIALTALLATRAPVGSVSLDILEALNWHHGGLGDRAINTVCRRVKGGSRESMTAWQRGWKVAVAEGPVAEPYGGRRSSLFLIWQVLEVLRYWPKLTGAERGEFYRMCRQLDAALAGEQLESDASRSPAHWLSGTA